MPQLTSTLRNVKPALVDESSTSAERLIQQSCGHDASGKQEIQDFTFTAPSTSSFTSTSIIESDDITSTSKSIEQLFQYPGRRYNTYHRVPNRMSWTDSRETHENSARREFHPLLANLRQANHLITVKYLREFSVQEIRMRWSVLKYLLQKQNLIAYVVVEVTTCPHVLPNGERRYYPINRIHYHFLIFYDLSERPLREIFKRACFDVGFEKSEFGIIYESIPDRITFERKCKYILKFDTFKEQAILFRPGTGISKVCSIGRWFINADGSRANKDKIWKSIVDAWYPKKLEVE